VLLGATLPDARVGKLRAAKRVRIQIGGVYVCVGIRGCEVCMCVYVRA